MSDYNFDWNVSQMNSFASIWDKIASRDFRKQLLDDIGVVAVALVHDEFETGRNPYGKRWAELKQPLYSSKTLKWVKTPSRFIGPNQILYRSGALANSIRFKIGNDMLVLYSPLKYLIFHQRGTKHDPQRLILPDPLIGLPERWKRAFDGAAIKAFQRLLYTAAFR